jgi:hypothetical protein
LAGGDFGSLFALIAGHGDYSIATGIPAVPAALPLILLPMASSAFN